MKFIKTPVKGMREFLPRDMELREYVLNEIKKTYSQFGFNLIETPCVEHIENLTSKQGGDNEKLIFKILKRGDKLKLSETICEENLSEEGLRYDLTVPLSRFYANNMNSLNAPFKSCQIGNVWRADRPQRGRFRQFTQCDIDILGESTILAEIDLITASTTLLNKFPFNNLKVRINDRQILKAMALYSGFQESELESVLISLDKIDKIGVEGVLAELVSLNFDKTICEKYVSLFKNELTLDMCKKNFLDQQLSKIVENLQLIISSCKSLTNVNIVFDPTLVRGMSYYTGTIFEIEAEGLNGSIAGGGRYDKMIEKYAGVSIPACGFSIGFERIITILDEINYRAPLEREKIAYVIEKNTLSTKLLTVLKEIQALRNTGKTVTILERNKNFKYQKLSLQENGYEKIIEIFAE